MLARTSGPADARIGYWYRGGELIRRHFFSSIPHVQTLALGWPCPF